VILKVFHYGENSSQTIFDNIDTFTHARATQEEEVFGWEEGSTHYFGPSQAELKERETPLEFIVASLERDGKFQRVIFPERWGFLMNDAGKTIERL
jgi:hypothetical protein